MLKSNPIPPLLLLALCSMMAPATAAEPVLVYQRIHSLVNHHDNRISLRLWADDTIEIRFPHYSPLAGHYQWQATANERSQLLGLMGAIPTIQQQQIMQRLQQARQTQLVEVADADSVRMEIRLDGRGEKSIMVGSPEVWARLIPDSEELASIAETERQLLEWMQQKTRGRAQ